MENLGLVVAESLETLCKHDGKSASELQGFLSKQVKKTLDLLICCVDICLFNCI